MDHNALLIQQVLAGDAQAFEQLVRRYHRRVFAHVRGWTRNQEALVIVSGMIRLSILYVFKFFPACVSSFEICFDCFQACFKCGNVRAILVNSWVR